MSNVSDMLVYVTLTISAICGPTWAFHASDRLVTVPKGEWDPQSNKTIVVIGSDCWLVMGYTGIAYLNNRSTDRLIAEAIAGYEVKGPISPFVPDMPLHYHEIQNRIKAALESAYNRLPAKTRNEHKTSVLASGFQRKSKGVKPVLFRMDVQGDSATTDERIDRNVATGALTHVSGAGQCEHGILNRMYESMNHYRDSPNSETHEPKVIRAMMMDAIVETALKIPDKVGKDVVGVFVDISDKKVSAKFVPYESAKQMDFAEQAGVDEKWRDVPSVSTPYMLGPGMIYSPALANPGGWVDVRTGVTFEYSGWESDSGEGPGGGYFMGQPRKPAPK